VVEVVEVVAVEVVDVLDEEEVVVVDVDVVVVLELLVLVVDVVLDDELDDVDVDDVDVVDVDELELVAVDVVELVLVDVVELVIDVVDDELDVDVVVELVVVDTDVVAVDVCVDVCVVDGDVTSQLKNVPVACCSISSLRACAMSCARDSPVGILSSVSRTTSITWTIPAKSFRQPTSKKVPSCRPLSPSVTSRRAAVKPGAVRVWQDCKSPEASVIP